MAKPKFSRGQVVVTIDGAYLRVLDIAKPSDREDYDYETVEGLEQEDDLRKLTKKEMGI